MAIARVLLLAHAVSVLSQSVPASSDQPGCLHLIVTTVTPPGYFAYEQSWLISAGSQVFESDPLANDATVENEICVEAGTYSITLLDSWADGWSDGSSVKIDFRGGGSVLAQTTLSGGEMVVPFDVLPPPPAADYLSPPPSPPKTPPGVTPYIAGYWASGTGSVKEHNDRPRPGEHADRAQ